MDGLLLLYFLLSNQLFISLTMTVATAVPMAVPMIVKASSVSFDKSYLVIFLIVVNVIDYSLMQFFL